MAYCLATIVITLLLRNQVLDWFELILYIQDEDEPLGSRVGADNRAARNARNNAANDPDNLLELTLNDDDDEGAENG